MVNTSNVGTSVIINWTLPYDGSSPLLYFVLEIETSTRTFIEQTTYCNARSDPAVITNQYCVLPMDILTSAPFNLIQGNIVVATISAANILGQSQFSMLNSEGADIRVAPLTPSLAPSRG